MFGWRVFFLSFFLFSVLELLLTLKLAISSQNRGIFEKPEKLSHHTCHHYFSILPFLPNGYLLHVYEFLLTRIAQFYTVAKCGAFIRRNFRRIFGWIFVTEESCSLLLRHFVNPFPANFGKKLSLLNSKLDQVLKKYGAMKISVERWARYFWPSQVWVKCEKEN